MAYIGKQPSLGNYQKLDDISSQFDGIKTTFATNVSGAPILIGSPYQLIVSLNGVVQEPNVAFSISNTLRQITFTTPPLAGTPFFALRFGEVLTLPTVTDGSVTSNKLASDSVTTVKILDGAVTTDKLATNAVAGSKIQNLGIATSKLQDSAVTLQKLADNAVISSKIASGAVTFDKLAAALLASQGQAEAGSATDVLMNPLRVAQAISALASGGIIDVQFFTSNGTWTKPTNCNKALVFVVGGGGAGTGVSGSIAYPGSSGSSSSFGSFVSATGGAASTMTFLPNGSVSGASGGIGSGGDLNIRGGSGGTGQVYRETVSGNPTCLFAGANGGDSIFGGGGAGGFNSAGAGGGNYGAGGGGSNIIASQGNHGGSMSGGGAGGAAIKWITSGLGATETVIVGPGGIRDTTPIAQSRGGSGASGCVMVLAFR